MDSRKLASVIGPVLLAMSVTEAINFDIFAAETAPLVYLNGSILFAAGLSVMRAHNRWTLDWRVLITVVGWAALALGLYRMVLPHAEQPTTGGLTTYIL